ncbi:hypothetical protein BKA62DRAFT_642092 [Auriculariales sp. MPI-PUGE-AT-0066]|nr:hypothetical protein BKA62DRAFT_642092 [Auriculariales sp. MPI-PUGE-AT-0066]
MNNLYSSNGTFFLVSDEPTTLPAVGKLTSRILPEGSPLNFLVPPTEDDIKVISAADAAARWHTVTALDGTTIIITDSHNFLGHFFHWCAEELFGIWLMLVGHFAPGLSDPNAILPRNFAQRMILTRIDNAFWMGSHHFNPFYVFTAFPAISVEDRDQWAQRTFITRDGKSAYRFEQVLLTDRAASIRSRPPVTEMIASGALAAVEKDVVRGVWWEPYRRTILRAAGAQILNDLPQKGHLITYISRQKRGRRCLKADDNDALVKVLEDLTAKRGWEFKIVTAEDLTMEEQVRITARSSVILGVHGNGLSHLLHQPPNAIVIEILYPDGYINCYGWTAHVRGLKYFAIHNNTAATYPLPQPEYRFYINPKDVKGDGGFHGPNIPIDAPMIGLLIEKQLDGRLQCNSDGHCLGPQRVFPA